jgi:hypothetical protein
MDFNKIYGAGLSNVSVRTADGTIYDLDAAVDASGDPSQDDIEIKGDDTIKAKFSSGRKEDLTLKANAISMDVLQAITGNAVSSSAGGSEVAQGTDGELNPPFVEVSGDVTARTDQGTAVVVRKIWHKVQLGMTKVTAGNGNELATELSGIAVRTDKDITGVSLTTARVATLKVIKTV